MTSVSLQRPYSALRRKVMPWFVVLVAALFFFYEFIQMNMFNVLSSTFQHHFHLNAFAIGMVSAFYFLSDSILLYPVGVLLDKFSSRTLILMGMLMCILGTFLMSIAASAVFLVVARLLAGTAAAFCLLSILRLGAQWFAPEKMGRISGVVITIGMLGGAISQTPLAFLVGHLGWRDALNVVALLGGVIFIIMFFVVRDAPAETNFAPINDDAQRQVIRLWPAFLTIIKNKHNWLIGLYICTMNLPIMLLAGLFGEQYLVNARGFTSAHGATASMMIFIGTIVGSTFFGYATDLMQSRKTPMLYSAMASLMLFVMVLYLPHYSFTAALGLFFALGFITAAQVVGYPVTRECNAPVLVGSALGFVSVIIMGLPGILQPLVGFIMDVSAHGQHFLRIDYTRGLSIMTVGFVISIICAWLLPETYGQSKEI